MTRWHDTTFRRTPDGGYSEGRTVSYTEYEDGGGRGRRGGHSRTIAEREDKFRTWGHVPYRWLVGWRDKQRHCMNVSLDNARLAREIAPEQVSRYARMALAHYREMRKHEAEMKRYDKRGGEI